MGKINVWRIIRDHLGTLRDYEQDTVSIPDALLFFGAPLALSGIGAWMRFDYGADVLNAFLYAFSIFAGLLLNLLVLICGFAGNPRFDGFDTASTNRRRYLREIHQNLSFAILVSIVVVLLAFAGLSGIKHIANTKPNAETRPVLSFLLTYTFSNFMLTLLMIVKRMHILLAAEFSGPRSTKRAA